MPKRSEQRDAAKAEYIARRQRGQKVNLKQLAEELDVPINTMRNWKALDKWEDSIPRKRGGQPGNANARGNCGGGAPKGNSNAEKDGAYSRIFWDKLTPEELAIAEGAPLGGVAALEHEMKVLKLREKNILDKISHYEQEPPDALYTGSLLDMRTPGGRGKGKVDGLNQNMGMYSKETPFNRIMKLQEALYKTQGRIAAVAGQLRQAEEFERRIELERERLEIMRMRATGTVEVNGEDETLYEQGNGAIPEPDGTPGASTAG